MKARVLANVLTIQLHYTSAVFARNLDGLDEESFRRAPTAGGNSAAWIAGHILHSRAAILQLLDEETPFAPNRYERFARGNAPLSTEEEVSPPADMMSDFNRTSTRLTEGLEKITDDAVDAKAPFSPGNDPEETVGTLLAGLVFHESYHTGQLGLLRRMAGLDGALT